jgi:chemotaxis protein CheD
MRLATDYERRRRVPPMLIGVGGIAWSGDVSVTYSTLLGSCIAVCLWDQQAMKGGITHFLLAEAPEGSEDDTRYGDVAVPLLADSLCQVGCQFERLQAIVAGGSDVLNNMKPIGTENTAYALAWLRGKRVPIVRKDVGGGFARRVRFSPTTGVCEITSIAT